jgi:hypothetical protein
MLKLKKRLILGAGTAAAALLLSACVADAGAADYVPAIIIEAEDVIEEVVEAEEIVEEEIAIEDGTWSGFVLTEIPLLTIFDGPVDSHIFGEQLGLQPFDRQPETLDLREWPASHWQAIGTIYESGVTFVNAQGQVDLVNGYPAIGPRFDYGHWFQFCEEPGNFPERIVAGQLTGQEILDRGYRSAEWLYGLLETDFCRTYMHIGLSNRDDVMVMDSAGQLVDGALEFQVYSEVPIIFTGAQMHETIDDVLVLHVQADPQGHSGQVAFALSHANAETFDGIRAIRFIDETREIRISDVGFRNWHDGSPTLTVSHWDHRLSEQENFLDQFRAVAPVASWGLREYPLFSQ